MLLSRIFSTAHTKGDGGKKRIIYRFREKSMWDIVIPPLSFFFGFVRRLSDDMKKERGRDY